MKLFLVLLLSTTLSAQVKPKTIATPVVNNSEICALNFPRLKSIFIPDPKLFKSFHQSEQDLKLRTLKQGVVLLDGTEIRMIKSGCAHYIFLLNIRVPEIKSQIPDYLFQLTVQMLNKIPVMPDEDFNLKLITNALDKRNWNSIKQENNYYILPCRGALCTLRTINNTAGPSDIEIIYDKTL